MQQINSTIKNIVTINFFLLNRNQSIHLKHPTSHLATSNKAQTVKVMSMLLSKIKTEHIENKNIKNDIIWLTCPILIINETKISKSAN